MSPEAMPLMARLGVGVIVVPQKPWDTVAADLETYRAEWRTVHGTESAPPAPLCAGNIVVDKDPARAEELAYRYIGAYYDTVIRHYGFAEKAHEGLRGYEFYAGISKYLEKRGREGAVGDYVRLMPWGTPEQVVDKLATLRDLIGMAAFNPSFSFADMPPDIARGSLDLFSREVLPVLKTWDTPEIPVAQPSTSGAGEPVVVG